MRCRRSAGAVRQTGGRTPTRRGRDSKAGLSSPSLTLCFETRGHLRWELMTNGPVSLFEARNFSGRRGSFPCSRCSFRRRGADQRCQRQPRAIHQSHQSRSLLTFAPTLHRERPDRTTPRECNSMYTFSRDADSSICRRPAGFPNWNLRQTDR